MTKSVQIVFLLMASLVLFALGLNIGCEAALADSVVVADSTGSATSDADEPNRNAVNNTVVKGYGVVLCANNSGILSTDANGVAAAVPGAGNALGNNTEETKSLVAEPTIENSVRHFNTQNTSAASVKAGTPVKAEAGSAKRDNTILYANPVQETILTNESIYVIEAAPNYIVAEYRPLTASRSKGAAVEETEETVSEEETSAVAETALAAEADSTAAGTEGAETAEAGNALTADTTTPAAAPATAVSPEETKEATPAPAQAQPAAATTAAASDADGDDEFMALMESINGKKPEISNDTPALPLPATDQFMLTIDNPDPNYHGQVVQLSDYDRAFVENIVQAECNTSYIGAALIAQCLRDTMLADGLTVEQVQRQFVYATTSMATDDIVRQAVSDVFDNGRSAVQHRIIYFYAPDIVYSAFHETQNFVCYYDGHRYFDRW